MKLDFAFRRGRSSTTVISRWGLLLVGILLATTASAKDDKKTPPPPQVEVAVIGTTAQPTPVAIPGTVEPLRESVVAARIGGAVAEVMVEAGTPVAAGAPLVGLDQREITQELALRQAELDQTTAQLAEDRRELARAIKLEASKAIAAEKVSAARTAVAVSEALTAQGKARVELARLQREWHQVVAPFAGVVTQRRVQVGEWVSPGAAVAALIAPDQVEFKVMLPAVHAGLLDRLGGAEVVLARGGAPLTATLLRTVPRLDPASRNRATFWSLPAAAKAVAGEAGVLNLTPRVTTLPLIPKDALLRSAEGPKAWLVVGNLVQPRSLKLGEAVGGFFQVTSGLKGGEQVVIRGNERLRPGQEVVVTNQNQPAAATGAESKPAK